MKRPLVMLLFLMQCFSTHAGDLSNSTFEEWVDRNGNISLPTNYRINWTHIGSWIVQDKEAPGYGFHDVYIQPEAARHFLKNRIFVDGTVLVKEVRAIHEGVKTTGPARWAGSINIWFVMIKDNKGRFKNNTHWANGWGWALFKAIDTQNISSLSNVSKGFSQSCQACHQPAQNADWVFLEGYPTLNEK